MKTLRWKEMEEDARKLKISCAHGKINIVKMSILPKEVYRFNAIPSKIPKASLIETEQS